MDDTAVSAPVRLRTSDQIDQLVAALVKAQAVMVPAVKGSENPHFHSRYADLAACVSAVRLPLSDNGLAYIQSPWRIGTDVGIATRLAHVSGQWVECDVSVTLLKTDAQAIGSALTYLRRYSLSAITGLATEDDDGNKATAAAQKPTPVSAEQLLVLSDWLSQIPGGEEPATQKILKTLKLGALTDLTPDAYDRAIVWAKASALKAKEQQA